MALTHSTACRDAMVNASVDLLDVGTTDATGDIDFQTAGGASVANLEFSNPAFGASSSGVATASAVTSDTNADGGTIAKFEHRNRNNVAVHFGSVTAVGGGGDYEITSVAVAAGETVAVTSLTYTGPA